jgi:Phosphoinositide phospholipase C, Ca2+-dependent
MTRSQLPLLALSAAVVLCVAAAAVSSPTSDHARMNQIQVLGSHNSYKQAIDPSLLSLLKKNGDHRLEGLEYSHIPIEKQLDLGLRALEIDVVYDPEGGRYAHPRGIAVVAENHLPPGPPYDPDGVMNKPGFKVMHIPDMDFRANAYTFQQELALLKAWSDAHPHHLPIPITMNAKDDGAKRTDFVTLLKFDKAAFDAWDAEIVAGLGRQRLITPDDVRGKYPTLEAAVLAHAWPTLASARGKFLFVLDETGQKLDTYVEGHPSLRGRIMFTDSTEGRPEAAFRIVNEAPRDAAYIQYLVRSGYYVRTRADSDTVEARKGDYSRWQQALISGAQVISTDYYQPDSAFGTGYHIQLPGGQPGRWNPLLLPEDWPLPALE